MTRCTVTDVAWFTRAHSAATAAGAEEAAGVAGAEDTAWTEDDAAADDVIGADDEAPAPAGAEAVTEPHPASAEHSSTASTGPRTWRGDIMLLGRILRVISSIAPEVPHSTPAAITAPADQQQGPSRQSLTT